MTQADSPTLRERVGPDPALVPWAIAGLAYAFLFWAPISGTARLWWTDADAGHGLLLVPLAAFLAWREGRVRDAAAAPLAGLLLIAAAVGLRVVSGLATELFTMRASALLALVGLIVFGLGWRQVRRWWLSLLLVLLSLPLPEIVLSSLALPLQFRASQLGAMLLEWRHVPVQLNGNVIQLPGHSLFVTEACSGLRSLSSLLAIGVLVGGLWLRTWWARLLIVATAIPIAMVLNGVRVFLTGFTVFYVDPRLGAGVMHYTEGWFMFVIALCALASLTRILTWLERPPPTLPASGGEVATG